MPKHIFFDLDNTLVPSRSPMLPEHVPIFARLCAAKDVIVVSGSSEVVIREEIPPSVGAYFILGQSGNHAEDKTGHILWQESFTPEQKRVTLDFIREIHDAVRLPVTNENDLVEDRGSQISYSMIGHNEDRTKKKAFDPDVKKRFAILAERAVIRAILKDAGVEVMPGGTTCFDFYLAGKHKGFNILRLIEHEGWQKDDCLYIGDALFPGGNDAAVIGVIPTHGVKDQNETFEYIKASLL